MGGVVVRNDVDFFGRIDVAIDQSEEAKPLGVSMAPDAVG
jgi:hypothetical protein